MSVTNVSNSSTVFTTTNTMSSTSAVTNTTSALGPTAMTPRITKFSLPSFAIKDDPDTWFSVADQIFAAQQVFTEYEKFGFLLQSLTHHDINYIKDIIGSDESTTKYTEAKQRLVAIYGKSQTEKIRKFLQGTNIDKTKKPSMILHDLRQQAGLVGNTNDQILREIWINMLPEKTRDMLALYVKQPLSEQAELADNLYSTYENKQQTVPMSNNVSFSDISVSAIAANSSVIENILSLINNLQIQVAAISSERQSRNQSGIRSSRSRNRSPTPGRQRDRSYSRRRGMFRVYVKNNLCTYHYKFGDSARKCLPGCKHYAGNES